MTENGSARMTSAEKKGKILILEDDKIDQMAFTRFAQRKKFTYQCHIVTSIQEARRRIQGEEYDAVVLDYILQDGTAFDLFDQLNGIPIIIVTGQGDEELAVEAMKRGAYDYLIKDAWGNHIKRIQFTVDKALERKQLETLVAKRTKELEEANRQIKKINQQLKQLVILDGLTGIPNYRRFTEVLQLEWRRAIRNSRPISIVLIDVDFFKLYNDTYGHQQGDNCLKIIARKLKNTCKRPTDLAARYGGEEFILVLSESDQSGALSLAKQLRSGVENLAIEHKTSTIAPCVTISLGCATVTPKAGEEAATLIKMADEALYASKKNGRNRITVADPGISESSE
jgi:diguanylate cyclase (GGDEF)-like protein